MATSLSSLVQLFCGKKGSLLTKTAGIWGECFQWLDHIGVAIVHGGAHAAQAPACSARALSQVAPASFALLRFKPLMFSGVLQGQRPRWAGRFVPFPGLSHSDDQVLGKRTVPNGPCTLCISLVLDIQFARCTMSHSPWCAMCLISGELILGHDTPGSCELSTNPGRCG